MIICFVANPKNFGENHKNGNYCVIIECFGPKFSSNLIRHTFDRSNTFKSLMIFHNFGSGSIFIFIFFPIATLWNFPKCNVIQQIKKCGLTSIFTPKLTKVLMIYNFQKVSLPKWLTNLNSFLIEIIKYYFHVYIIGRHPWNSVRQIGRQRIFLQPRSAIRTPHDTFY